MNVDLLKIDVINFTQNSSDPVIESRLGPNRSMITNSQVDIYNKAALELL